MALLVGAGSRAQDTQALPLAEPAAQRSSVQWQLMVGGLSALDGYSDLGHQGIYLGAGWEFPGLRFRFQFLAGLPNRLRDERTEVNLEQYTFGFWLDQAVMRSGAWRWGVGGGAGVLVFARSVEPLFRGVDAAKPRLVPALLVGPDTSVRYRLSRLVAVEGTVALDVVLGRPVIGYVNEQGFLPLHSGWAVQPRLGLAFMILP
ncbi:hypothetical protein [Pyxidicoccus xibeiensis]|uniref:hypothetical protein n=1 Tax=Pyxidicoccus xibeiensis TaxID=2906759 RepID=UPI0020A818E5|nr:hypothetical protein [Pyxidicoccus xibeiensis]MCP3139355.1 hypothetical protein [Pyxidicoccus xibeiensis]